MNKMLKFTINLQKAEQNVFPVVNRILNKHLKRFVGKKILTKQEKPTKQFEKLLKEVEENLRKHDIYNPKLFYNCNDEKSTGNLKLRFEVYSGYDIRFIETIATIKSQKLAQLVDLLPSNHTKQAFAAVALCNCLTMLYTNNKVSNQQFCSKYLKSFSKIPKSLKKALDVKVNII